MSDATPGKLEASFDSLAEPPASPQRPNVDPRLAKAAQHWSQIVAGPSRTRWWESKLIVRHINRRYCGEEVDGTDGGDIVFLGKIQAGKFERAVSVGCGSAYHELQLLAAGVVGEFVLYELSEKRAADALASAKAKGLADRVTIHVSDPFEPPPKPEFDLVYWKDALHHMFDAHGAVHWSKQVLKPNGTFFMNEFVGPTYMQYTERQLDLAESARRALPDEFLVDPHDRKQQVGYRRARPTIAGMLAEDPTECADSSAILPAVRSAFPDVKVIPTGGIVYMLALNDILANMDEVEDAGLLRAMLLADDLCVEAGETLYSVAFAPRRAPPRAYVGSSGESLPDALPERGSGAAPAPSSGDGATVIGPTAALASCNVCGGSQFQPGPFKRLSMTGRLPCCIGCDSLERHRIARRIIDCLPDSLIGGKRVLQFGLDRSVDGARVAEHRVAEHRVSEAAPGSLDMQAIAVEDGRYDWVVSHHVLNSVENDVKGLQEMLRVAGPNGVVLLTVGGTSDTLDTQSSPVATGPYRTFKRYGSDFVARFYEHVPYASALELVATDPCTATLDVVFLYSRDIAVLREIGHVIAPKNVYARLTTARDLDQPTASTPTAASTRPASRAEPPLPTSAPTASVAQGARNDPRWQPLVDELSEWKRVGRTPRFWVRDDDATRENAKLEALYQVCATNRVTLACAAIPMSIEPSLIEWAKGKTWLVMLQHGFDHVNRAAASASSSSEFPDQRELGDALQAIRNGQKLMSSFGPAQLPVFVPPWGNIAAQVAARLGELGFIGVSTHYLRRAPRQDGIAVTNTHVLLPRLTERRWSLEIELVVGQLVNALASVRGRPEGDSYEPIGVNTHHLGVGEPELLALDSLVHVTRSCGAEWPHPSDLFGQAS